MLTYGHDDQRAALQRTFSELEHLGWDGAKPNAPLDQTRRTDRAPVIRRIKGGLELEMLRWGIVPASWCGTLKAWTMQLCGNPLTNARSEPMSVASAFREL